jgi:uncharacterized protein
VSLQDTGDSFCGMELSEDDTLGMVGFFRPLMSEVKKSGCKLVILEKNQEVISHNIGMPLTSDAKKLRECNKICITSTTVLNRSIDTLLPFCDGADFVAVVGPTAGFLPDPLFDRGVDVLGGRFINNGELLLQNLAGYRPWGATAENILFRKRIM